MFGQDQADWPTHTPIIGKEEGQQQLPLEITKYVFCRMCLLDAMAVDGNGTKLKSIKVDQLGTPIDGPMAAMSKSA